MKPNTIYGVAYATFATAIAAATSMALGGPAWLVITLWLLYFGGSVFLVWYCWKITHPSTLDDLEASIARERAALIEDIRKARWSPRESLQAEQRCHRVGETPVVYQHPDFNVKGTQTGRGEEIVDLEDMDRGGSE
jgi:hypothetical protein